MLFSQRSACDRCRALKSRCSRESGAAKCERCQRLQIDCFYSPPRRMGRPAKKRLNQENTNAPTQPSGYRRASTMSNVTVQSSHSEIPTPTNNDANDFQYGLDIIQSHPAEDTTWTENFEDPLLGLLHNNDPKMVSTEWMDQDALRFLEHQDDAILPDSHVMPLTPPTTVGSLPNGSDDTWMPSCEPQNDFGHPESFACDTLPSSPEPKSTEPATQRLLDLQSRLFSRHMTKTQDVDGLSAAINTAVHSTETLIEIVESLPQLRPSVEGRRSTSPLSSTWGAGSDPAGFNVPATNYTATESQLQQNPYCAITISLFITCYLLLLDSYDELLSALRARLQCSRQSQGPSPTSDMGLTQPFFNSAPTGNLNKFNLVSSFDLDVNSVVFLLSRMMKRLNKSTESRFVAVSMENPTIQSMKVQNQGGYTATQGAVSYDFQDAASQDTDGFSEPSPGGSFSPMIMMGNFALAEVSQRHQRVMESLRVIRWLADEL
ncbi:uncharacterized protein CTRU02_206663 [Colletotrichum truncatum]|uniref:Uncharacterized protein n=1 Tax=Colletotrichum truncatum TaxID=5467 RepID=A0ACC3Z7I0_COLTU|nr:uncharacterized protein CTRU02_13783 [Colletotrichum truncatum]KAF6782957.1 hypothetical protein CTRU02_13783 [Colletotrichum truncatum]